MAQYNRPPKQKKKGPDEFISFFDRLVRYFLEHRAKFFVLLGLAGLAFVAYGVYLYYQSGQVKEFATFYEQALKAPEPKALAEWQALAQQKPPLGLTDIIAIQMGGVLAQENKWEQAAGEFNRVVNSRFSVLKYLSQWASAVALENGGQYGAAYQEYEKMLLEKENPFRDYGRLGMARCLRLQGKIAEAQTLLSQLATNAQTDPAIQAEARRQLLALQLPPKSQ